MTIKWDSRGIIEKTYQKRLLTLFSSIGKLYGKAENASDIREISRRIFMSPEFRDASFVIAEKMIMSVSNIDANTWREAARKSRNSRFVYQKMQEEIKGEYGAFLRQRISENTSLIGSVPDIVQEEFAKYAASEAKKGMRAGEIVKEFISRQIPKLSEARAKLIARTEASKAHTDVIEARSLSLGLPCYVWKATKGGRTRPSHKNLDDVIVFWKDPPSPEAIVKEKEYGKYHAGKIFNCRCYPAPLISADDVSWPHKVYRGGQIATMKKADFIQIVR